MNSKRLIGMAMSAASVAFATDYTWNQTSGTGSFQTSSYWTPAGLPGAADKTLFTAAGTYGVSFADQVVNASATVGASGSVDVTFDLGGYTWQLTNSNPLTLSGTATARFGGGTLDVARTNTATYNVLSPNPGPNQTLVLASGTSIFRGFVGTTAGGTIEINGGTHSLLSGVALYAAPAGGSSFRITDGTVTVDTMVPQNNRFVLNSGSASLSLRGGTLVSKAIFDVYGGAVIDVTTNATFITPQAAFNFARTGGAKSTLNISGGTVSNTTGINVGQTIPAEQSKSSTGLVSLVDGVLHASSITLGSQTNAVGVLSQSGGLLRVPGSITLGNMYHAWGVYTQEAGTAWCGTLSVGAGFGSTGELYLTGGAWATPNAIYLGNGNGSVGRLIQSGGGLITSNNLIVGCLAGAYGVYSNTGGRTWCNQLRVGAAANATGAVYLAGGTLAASGIAGASYIGEIGGASAKMFQSGGELIVSNTLVVGSATGAAGAFTNTGGSVWLSGTLYVGNSAGTSGKMFFNGSSLEAQGGITVGNTAFSTGELTIAGGWLPLTNANLTVGSSANSLGKLEICGGSNLFNNINAGTFGAALVRVTGGYTYTTNRLIVGAFASSTGRLELAGGILSTPIIDGRDPASTNAAGGYSEVLFDGGTLQHSVDSDPTWMPVNFVSVFAKATLTERGAVIDSNGGTLAIPQSLSNETGQAGSFTKKGAGKLSLLSGANGFTGRVTVEQGELAVSGNIYLSGGVVINTGALLNLSSATVNAAQTASGTVSRIDGTLWLKPGGILTNGLGATLGGSGAVTGKVMFATGSAWAHDKADAPEPLTVSTGAVFQTGVTVRLTGYTAHDLETGIPLLKSSAGAIQLSGWLPVTLDGVSKDTWWAILSDAGKTLTARVIPFGTMISVR